MNVTPKPRLRWYQYSLRSLFVVTVLVAIVGSWFAVKRQQVERERVAVKWVKEMGGVIGYDWESDAAGMPIPNAAPPGPALLRAWLEDDFFARVTIVGCFGEKVTDAGLEHLKGLTQVKSLSLYNTHVTDAGLEHLNGMTQLGQLDLGNTRVTDTGLEHLKGMTQLQRLSLYNTKVTHVGVTGLQEALPNCTIIR